MRIREWVAGHSQVFVVPLVWLLIPAVRPACAQTGAPIISTGSNTSAPDAVTLDVAKIDTADTDICKRIQKGWQALSSVNGVFVDSGVLDARSITGGEPASPNCTVDPFLDPSTGFTTAHHGILMLGNVVIQTTVPWQIPSHISVNGIGDPGSFVGQNTLLQAAAGYSFSGNLPPICVANALVCLGHGSQAFRAQVSNMALDCNDQPGCIAAYNGASQEGSWFQGVTLANAPAAGLMISLNSFTSNGATYFGAVNSGPYHNVSVQYWAQCTPCNASTAGVLVQNSGTANSDFGGVVRDLDNVTVSAFNACPGNAGETCPGTGFLIEGASANITNSHVEYFSTALQIGANGFNTNGVEITNLYLSNTNTGTGVWIWAPAGSEYSTGDITISGLNYGANGSSLLDQVGGNTLSDPFIAFYAVGHRSGSLRPKVISTSPNLTDGTGGGSTGGNPH
jgi:hypothetical protein